MREKLIELLLSAMPHCYSDLFASQIADHLIANGVTVQKWIPVTERFPEADVRVLVWLGENDSYFPIIDTDRVHKDRWVRWHGYITHWMPLPEAPKGE